MWSWARKDNLTIHRAQTHTHRERKSEREQQHQHTHTSRYIGKKLFHSEPSATYRSPASKAFLYTHTQLPPPPSTPLSIQPAPNDFQFSSSFSLFFFPCCIILYYIIYRFLLPLQQRKERRVSYCYYSSGLSFYKGSYYTYISAIRSSHPSSISTILNSLEKPMNMSIVANIVCVVVIHNHRF